MTKWVDDVKYSTSLMWNIFYIKTIGIINEIVVAKNHICKLINIDNSMYLKKQIIRVQ